jgi:branched-chain amino acid transport system substrate-binding protein
MDKPQTFTPRILQAGVSGSPLPQPVPGDQPVVLAQITELTGTPSPAGDQWRDGVEMAVVEINAQGGLLGRPLQLLTYDSQSTPAGARASTQRALEAEPLALLGPVSSLTAIAIAPMLRDRRVCLVTGAESGVLLAQANPYVVLTGPGQALRLAKLARWAHGTLRARKIAVLWSNTEAEREIRESFVVAARKLGLEIAVDAVIAPSQPQGPYAASLAADLSRIAQAAPDAVFLAASAEQAGRALIELRAKLPTTPVFGEASLLSPKILDQAGAAAIGLRVHIPVTADAPLAALEDFRDRFHSRFKEMPQPPAIKAYISVAMIKAAVEKIGRIDPHAIADALRGASMTARQHPGLLLDTDWTAAGEADRVTFIAELRADRQLTWSALPPMFG